MKYLIDSDFWVALVKQDDGHHQEVVEAFRELKRGRVKFFSTNLVLQEVGTVLSHKVSAEAVRIFYKKVSKLGLFLIRVGEKSEKKSWDIFLQQTKKGCSFVDCSNLAIVDEYNLDGILSFDKFYPKDLRKI